MNQMTLLMTHDEHVSGYRIQVPGSTYFEYSLPGTGSTVLYLVLFSNRREAQGIMTTVCIMTPIHAMNETFERCVL